MTGADDPDLSTALTRSTARVTLLSPDLLSIICGNGNFSQAVGDTSFPLWTLGGLVSSLGKKCFLSEVCRMQFCGKSTIKKFAAASCTLLQRRSFCDIAMASGTSRSFPYLAAAFGRSPLHLEALPHSQ